MNKGDKVIYTYFYHPFDIGYGTGYYLFSLNKRQHEEPYHLVTSNQSLVEKIVDYDYYLSSVDGAVDAKVVFYVYEYNIRPFSKILAKRTEQTYSFFKSHYSELELLLFSSSDPKRFRQYYSKIEKYSLSYPRIVLNYYRRKILNTLCLPLKIITFDLSSVFTFYREYIDSEAAFKNEERKLSLAPADVQKRRKAEISELIAFAEGKRETFIKSNRAIIGYAVAIITLLVTTCLQFSSNKMELMLNERINVLYRENQSLKEEANYLNGSSPCR